jgi:UDP-glucose 4-epimerase
MILVTGGLGFIGSHIALSLMAQGQQVVIVDNLSNSDLKNLKRLEYISGMSIPFAKVDIRNTPALLNVIQQYSVRSVVHAAGFKSLEESIMKPLEYYNSNVSCIMSLLRAMQRSGIRNLMHLSSLAVYGKSDAHLTEDEPFNYEFNNPYVKSQQMIEQIIKDTFITDPEWNITILRIGNVAGAYENTILGEVVDPLPKNIIPLAMQVASGERDFLELRLDADTEDKTVERSFLHVLDVCTAVSFAIQWLYQQGHVLEIFNIAGALTSMHELVKTIANVTEKQIPILEARNFDSIELAQLGSDSQKAQDVLNWKPIRTIEQMIVDEWKYYQIQLSD